MPLNKSNDSETPDLTPSPGVSVFVGTTSDPTFRALDPNDRSYWPISLSHREVKTVRRALKRLRRETWKNQQRNERLGWKPEPGREDVVALMLAAVEDLLERLPHPGFEGEQDQ